jgi:hypothetical protein
MSFAGPAPTTRVNLSMDGRRSHSETWMCWKPATCFLPTPNFCRAGSCGIV